MAPVYDRKAYCSQSEFILVFVAHTKRLADGSIGHHRLEDHLLGTAAIARSAASRFGAGPWAELAGRWHDLGKYRTGFQRYLRQTGDPDAHIESRVLGRDKTHSAAGALFAEHHLSKAMGRDGAIAARVLQYLIAGHHAGLDNWHGGLAERLSGSDARTEFQEAMEAAPPPEIIDPTPELAVRGIPVDGRGGVPGCFALWVRMLFSCLVDADFRDTEAFMDGERSAARAGSSDIATLLARLREHMALVEARSIASPVNRLRSDVLRQCREKAKLDSGVFTLTVPTGGGKTLSSLAFALAHAACHSKRRVVYAIPYTSIIEQTAGIFREIFGDDDVIEHHSNAEAEPEKETHRSRLACENWDAPLIVTTNVQLFESLFARRTSRCRKLHNLVDSVIVLDEAQLIPVEFLQPILDVLRLLVRDYGVTLVLCTATQPALATRATFDARHGLRGFGVDDVTEIIDDVPALYAALKRVRVHLPSDFNVALEWPALGDRILRHDAVLAIVNRRADARELYRIIHDRHPEGAWHLSALMCPQHRSDTIAAIRTALSARREARDRGLEGLPVRVISTQLVEAGVDLDFPVVYRAMAGLDSIAQAAGRCNREGRSERGEVHVFVPPKLPPPGLLRQAEIACRTVLTAERPLDPFDLALFTRYFHQLYADANLDKFEICRMVRHGAQADVAFRDAADAFRLIDNEESATLVVRYRPQDQSVSPVDALVAMLERDGPRRWLLRALQRYGVSIYRRDLHRLLAIGDVREIASCPGLYFQVSDLLYDAVIGVDTDGAPGDPAGLYV